jgi:hypothetical protein
MWDYDRLFEIIESPSGVEAEINQLLMQKFAALGVEVLLTFRKMAITCHQ